MASTGGQAAGLAVGAAVGSVLSPVGAVAGAAIGSSVAGFLGGRGASGTQQKLDNATLRLNQEQARLKAAEASEIHAEKFKKSLASNIALASMRGGSSSLIGILGQESYGNFLRDQKAIDLGLEVSEAGGAISKAESTARKQSRDLKSYSTLGQSLSGINLNLTRGRDGKGT